MTLIFLLLLRDEKKTAYNNQAFVLPKGQEMKALLNGTLVAG